MTSTRRVVTRQSLRVRLTVTAAALLFLFVIVRGPDRALPAIIECGLVCLLIPLLSYRAEIDTTEVRMRYLPFHVRRTPISDVVDIIEKGTVVFVTSSRRIAIWGLSDAAMRDLVRLLPGRLKVKCPPRARDAKAGRSSCKSPAALAVDGVYGGCVCGDGSLFDTVPSRQSLASICRRHREICHFSLSLLLPCIDL